MKSVVEFPDRRVVAEEAAEWLIRLDADTPPTREELHALGEWLHRSPVHRQQLESLAALWGRLNVLTELAVPLGHPGRPAARASFTRGAASWSSMWRRAGLVAASLTVAITLGLVLLARGPTTDPLFATNGLYATAVGQQQTTMLADGSQIILNTNSQIKVDYGDGYRRVHLLQGEALFTVAKNRERPFRVYAGNGRIEALGTAFSVYLKDSDVSVAVTEGRVSLASVKPVPPRGAPLVAEESRGRAASGSTPDLDDAPMESLGTLAAGQVATIRSAAAGGASGASVLEAVQSVAPEELDQRLAWREGILMFSGETLQEVIDEFGRYTTVSIEIPDAAVRNVRIGGRFPAGETEAMLAALEANFNLRVTRVGHNRVVISAADG